MANLLFLAGTGPWDRLGLSLFYVSLSLLTLILLALSFLFGGHDEADHDIDHDVDHDTDHDSDHESGGSQSNLSPFSTKVILGFAFGFGFGGYIGARLGYGWTGCNVFGVFGGIAFGALIFTLMNALYRRQGNSTVVMSSLIGKTAIVDIAIGAGSVGRISLELPSGTDIFRARSADGTAIPSGTAVTIISLAGGETLVRKVV